MALIITFLTSYLVQTKIRWAECCLMLKFNYNIDLLYIFLFLKSNYFLVSVKPTYVLLELCIYQVLAFLHKFLKFLLIIFTSFPNVLIPNFLIAEKYFCFGNKTYSDNFDVEIDSCRLICCNRCRHDKLHTKIMASCILKAWQAAWLFVLFLFFFITQRGS